MPTLDDLRLALRDREQYAGDTERVLLRVREHRAQAAAQHPTPGARSRRRLAVIGLAAAVVAAVVLSLPLLIPAGAPGGATPAAAEFTRLAGVVANSPSDDVQPGQYLHIVVNIRQGDAPLDHVVLESWTAYDGTVWRKDINNGPPLSYVKIAAGQDGLSPAALDRLATNQAALNALLPDSGADIFGHIHDLMLGGTAPLALRAGLFTRLENTPGIEIGPAKTDILGRTAVEFDYDHTGKDDGSAGIESLFFDPSTAQLIQYTQRPADAAAAAYTFTTDVTTAEVVDTIPADVLRNAR